jgi:hypothetical protein
LGFGSVTAAAATAVSSAVVGSAAAVATGGAGALSKGEAVDKEVGAVAVGGEMELLQRVDVNSLLVFNANCDDDKRDDSEDEEEDFDDEKEELCEGSWARLGGRLARESLLLFDWELAGKVNGLG